jgi:hypothetical protein
MMNSSFPSFYGTSVFDQRTAQAEQIEAGVSAEAKWATGGQTSN